MAIEAFRYPAGPEPSPPLWEAWNVEIAEPTATASVEPIEPSPLAFDPTVVEAMRTESERRLAEETRRSFEAGRERGRLEERQTEQETQALSLAAEQKLRKEQAAALVEIFQRERDAFLQTAEQEVVKLSLAIAARILRREAQMDPLLLSGAVRVALGQISASTQVRLRVPEADKDLWTEAIAVVPNLPIRPTVMAAEDMRLGECIIETEMGSVDIGVRAQLAEIERGFFDRIPSPTSVSSSASLTGMRP